MNIVIAGLILLLLPASAMVGVMALNLRSSDAAGNGLALVYTLFFAAVLWGLLGLTMLLACLRPAAPAIRAGHSWGLIGGVGLILFLMTAVSQCAAIAGLADRRAAGAAQLALRATVFAAPLAVLLHAAWRVYGPPIPAWAGLGLSGATALACIAIPWPTAARAWRPEPAVSPDRIAYPAALLWESRGFDIIDSPDHLRRLPGHRLQNPGAGPLLIDSLFRTYRLDHLQPAGPSAPTDEGALLVDFRLHRLTSETPTQTVRERFLDALPADTDPARRERAIAQLQMQETLDGMIRAGRGD